jgi:hypothetical protein
MASEKNGTRLQLLDALRSETSGRILRAMALVAQDAIVEAEVEWLHAAAGEEQVACLLEAEGHDLEAAVHRVSAASCFARVQQYSHAVTQLRAALSFSLRPKYRQEIEGLLKKWLSKAKAQVRKEIRKQPTPVS